MNQITGMKNLVFSFFLLPCFAAVGQNYNTAAGLRVGGGLGVTVQQRVGEKITIEGILQKKLLKPETKLSALAEYHQPIIGKGVNVYFGVGPHFLFDSEYDNAKEREVQKIHPGVSGIAGLEIPLGRTLVSADIKPGISLGGSKILDSDLGISLRYILVKRPKKVSKLAEKFPFLQKKRKR